MGEEYPVFYRAMVHRAWGWDIISRHRKQTAAKKALEYFNEHGYPKPKPKKKQKKT